MDHNPILDYKLSLSSDIPLYAQLVGIIKQNISSGKLGVGDLLPSEAELCRAMDISRNTVRQAIGELEEEGLVQSHAGAKSFVCATREQRDALRRELTENELRGMVRDMKRLGLTAAEAALLVEKLYAEEESE